MRVHLRNRSFQWFLGGIQWFLDGFQWFLDGFQWFLDGIQWFFGGGFQWFLDGVQWILDGFQWFFGGGFQWFRGGFQWFLAKAARVSFKGKSLLLCLVKSSLAKGGCQPGVPLIRSYQLSVFGCQKAFLTASCSKGKAKGLTTDQHPTTFKTTNSSVSLVKDTTVQGLPHLKAS